MLMHEHDNNASLFLDRLLLLSMFCIAFAVDMIVCVIRYGSVYRQMQSTGGQSVQSKLDAARDEVEDCVAKVDQTRVRQSLHHALLF